MMLQPSRHRRPPIVRRRTRAQTACISCKEKKLKCDDLFPSCNNCQRFNIACLSEDSSTKRRLPRNYLETLEERVEFLEGLLQQQGQRQIPPGLRPQSLDHVDSSARPFAAANRDDDDGSADLVSKAGVLSLHASGAEPHYLGPSSMFSFSRVIHACVRDVVQEGPSSAFDPSSEEDASIAPCQLPSYEVGLALSNAYFENIHFQYPFLHEPTFRKWENKALGIDPVDATPTELFFVNAIYAVASFLKANHGTRPQQFYASALLYIDHVLARKNIEAIQAVLCCAMYSLRSPTGPSTWNLAGLALRQCIELGYHRNVKKINLATNVLRLEMRKRVFWCAHQIDCAASVNLGLPLSVSLQEIDTDFPLDIDDSSITESGIQGLPRSSPSDPATTLSNALHQFRIRCIWARIHASLYSNSSNSSRNYESQNTQVQSLRKELEDWMASTPPEPRRVGPPLCIFASRDDYKITYSETILLLYRWQLTGGNNVHDDVFLECMQAASNICYACKRLYLGKPINYTWGTLHVIFLAGLTYLHCIWTSPTVRRTVRFDGVSKLFTTCTMLLTIMAERWESAAPYRDLFEALAARAMSMMVGQDTNGEDATEIATPSQGGNPGSEDLTQWAAQIVDVGMPDVFGTLLSGLIVDFDPEAQELQDNLWNF